VGKFDSLTLRPESVDDIRDGTSHTLMIGEQAVTPDDHQYAGAFWAYPYGCYSQGYIYPESGTLMLDMERCLETATNQFACICSFGSLHPGIVEFVACDGSVHEISTDIDMILLSRLSGIADGEDARLP